MALTTQCDACIHIHTEDAITLDASEQELAEVTYIAASMRAGGTVIHAMKALSIATRAAKLIDSSEATP